MSKEQATKAANEVMQDPQRALLVHAREEFGIDPTQLPNPISVAAISLVTFLLGAFLPIIPWMIGGGNGARIASIVIGLAAAAIAGGIIGRQAQRSVVRSALRQVAVLIIAVTVTYAVGSVVGVNVS
jgi:VIT1/CCC1 family predicted Fe2+/Mn2+ transporter